LPGDGGNYEGKREGVEKDIEPPPKVIKKEVVNGGKLKTRKTIMAAIQERENRCVVDELAIFRSVFLYGVGGGQQ